MTSSLSAVAGNKGGLGMLACYLPQGPLYSWRDTQPSSPAQAGNKGGSRTTGLFPGEYIQVFIEEPKSINMQLDRAQPQPQRPA